MNRILRTVMTVGMAGIFVLLGCKTVGGGSTFDLGTAASALQLSANIGTYFVVKSNPPTKPIFQAVASTIDLLVNNQNSDTNALAQAISALTQSNTDVAVAVNAVLGLYESDFADAVTAGIDKNTVAVTLLKAFEAGINQGLSQTAPKLQKHKSR